MAAVTNIATENNVTCSLKMLAVKSVKSRCWQVCFPSGSLGENLSLTFFSFWRPPAFLGLWLLPLVTGGSALVITSSATDSDLLLYSLKDPCDDFGPTWTGQNNVPIPNFITSASPFCNVGFHSARELGCAQHWQPLFCLLWGLRS